jgi:hypothetical protein
LSSAEAVVLIDPAFASFGVIASSLNKSLKGVNPVDLDAVVLWLHTCWGPSASEGPQKHDLTMFLE